MDLIKSQISKVKSQKYKLKNQKLNSDSQNFKMRSYKLTLAVMKLIETLPNRKSYWSLADQLFRSTSSIGANIIEAKSASSRKDFIKFYEIALKSANETKFWLCLIRDSKCGDINLANQLLKETEELSKIIAASILTLKGKREKY